MAISGFSEKIAIIADQSEKFSLSYPPHKFNLPTQTKLKGNITKTTMTTENINDYVKYNEKHGVLICIPHGYSLTPADGISGHFQRLHQSTSLATRKKIVKYGETLALTDPDDVIPPDPQEGPIEGLDLEKNGFYCTYEECNGYVSAKEGTMIQHCKHIHGWKLSDGVMWRNQAVQTFFLGIMFFNCLTFRKIL